MPEEREIALQARIATLEQLLDVYERSVLEQADRLLAEQELLRVQTSLLRSQGEASPDAILSVSRDGRILYCNRRISDLWGIRQPEPDSDSPADTLQAMALRTRAPQEFLKRFTEVGETAEFREEILLRDERALEVFTAPIRSAWGEIFGRVWRFHDVSESRRISRLKDEFISNVSHELRTPLTSIRGSLGLIAGGVVGEIPAEARSLIEMACSSSERLERLVNDILDMEKVEAGQLEFCWQVVSIPPLLEKALEANASFAEQYGVSLRLAPAPEPCAARVDPDRLLAVLTNLLSNAAKFSQPGGVVAVSCARRDGRVRIFVSDRGSGIPHEFQPRVFEKFSQADPEGMRERPGTGLGLSIARAVVLRLGGDLEFESEPGRGTTFWFDLPEWRE